MDSIDRLSSWKEIASYLGVDERTCQRWEKSLGLPVMRLDASAKSRVFASKAEIEAWMARVSIKNVGSAEGSGNGKMGRPDFSTWIRHSKRRRNILRAGIALAVVACAAALLIKFGSRDRVPANFRIDGQVLVITNKAGHELWRKDVGLPDLQPEAKYRSRFQVRRTGEDRGNLILATRPLLKIGDFDQDGTAEVLFAPINEPGTVNGKLHLYDSRGGERWVFDVGVEVAMGRRTYRRSSSSPTRASNLRPAFSSWDSINRFGANTGTAAKSRISDYLISTATGDPSSCAPARTTVPTYRASSCSIRGG
jgi:hypothetical protein